MHINDHWGGDFKSCHFFVLSKTNSTGSFKFFFQTQLSTGIKTSGSSTNCKPLIISIRIQIVIVVCLSFSIQFRLL